MGFRQFLVYFTILVPFSLFIIIAVLQIAPIERIVVGLLFLVSVTYDGYHYIRARRSTPPKEFKFDENWVIKYYVLFCILLIVYSAYLPDDHYISFE